MLPRLKAERQLAAIEAASFPDMDARARREILNKYRQALDEAGSVPATEAGLAAVGIAVEHVTADGLPVARDTTGHDEGVEHGR